MTLHRFFLRLYNVIDQKESKQLLRQKSYFASSINRTIDGHLLLGIILFGLSYCLLCICNPELRCVLCTGALQGVMGGMQASLSEKNFNLLEPVQ